MPADPKSEYILELENVSKYFGSVRCIACSATPAPASPR